jgi:hypothetical protein
MKKEVTDQWAVHKFVLYYGSKGFLRHCVPRNDEALDHVRYIPKKN